jgi:hypothetical protein
MKAYVMTTGTVFGLIVAAHIWRLIDEGSALAKHPAYLITTLAAASLCVWACRILVGGSRP